jgi:hypothetical protein
MRHRASANVLTAHKGGGPRGLPGSAGRMIDRLPQSDESGLSRRARIQLLGQDADRERWMAREFPPAPHGEREA